MSILNLVFLQQEKSAEAFGQMIGVVLFLIFLVGLLVWGISKLLKRK